MVVSMQRSSAKKSSQGNTGVSSPPRKRISFMQNRNTVRLVKPPPRCLNSEYWFTETMSIVKKGDAFEIRQGNIFTLEVEKRMQLTSVASRSPTTSSSSSHDGSDGRVSLQIMAADLFGLRSPSNKWLSIASVREGEVEKVRVILPEGIYMLRCVGRRPVQVFVLNWCLIRRLG
ncbi:hypothetical protein, conserved [Trypanosoma brucei gambiense DAL972]|uniref:Uncharacterized protein n=2 Tax=Trypanosoma brucei TaxID=5691 RepID=Q384N3_TRYB2|nr:hypothetical protein, conserved [Trypanosoma brucei gambiense DAL972]XP_828860.1 hypothetical protein, conserved [Trypanosoma brucei brucei TREU927]EAN79748.1 hypothetical protein, conserved [Trypanosoma brucei brucei TREU927]CBH17776.1 hypothetical protein, conserved [Trypanosoma brucei gambiense DAL972]|eukprot:XP_011780040.1 hypothetical protein, conserved [Trypanosoma brucei gambiense DAL972]